MDGITAMAIENTIVNSVYNNGNILCNSNSSLISLGGICGSNSSAQSVMDNNYIKNAYNIGEINTISSNTVYIGSICGETMSKTIIENCYYLQNSQYGGIGQDKSSSNEIFEFTNTDKEILVEKLNNGTKVWTYDINNINKGYPIFNWQ